MLLLGRHAITAQNKEGGTDTPQTPLLPEGEEQARGLGAALHSCFLREGIREVEVITSGFERTEATARIALHEVLRLSKGHRSPAVKVGSWIKDGRLGEIIFMPKDSPEDLGNPGFFGRRIAGETREQVLARLQGFYDDHLVEALKPGCAKLVIGHRSSNQILVQDIIGISVALGKKHNCELWRIDLEHLEVVHYGIKAARDAEDPRRLAYTNGQAVIGTIQPVARARFARF